MIIGSTPATPNKPLAVKAGAPAAAASARAMGGDQLICTPKPDGTLACKPAGKAQESPMRPWQKWGLGTFTLGGTALGGLFGLFAAGMASRAVSAAEVIAAMGTGALAIGIPAAIAGVVLFWVLPSIGRAWFGKA